MEVHRLLISLISIGIMSAIAETNDKLEIEYPAAVPASLRQPVKPRTQAKLPFDASLHQREKKWSLYMIPDPPYGRGPYPAPAAVNLHYPYMRPRYVLERNSYPSDDFQFFYY